MNKDVHKHKNLKKVCCYRYFSTPITTTEKMENVATVQN